ncbi:regulatory LuxR family protein [Natranaerovirga hydrolytica]|uniref:Regulatory LuxR family protein n=1 Tax=Natranaerovirga hydrolytica TaxID=680378 RepID=A0A4R1MMN3_9FIRM|nr:LuxR family transcriptional regulator [Natranaerovirga hydrolytica]TCK93152.1 regulatory LuxR family protein [Natranaerovirga hydrolytica]
MKVFINKYLNFKCLIRSSITNHKTFTIVGFSLFFGWLLAVPFEGQVLYRLVDNTKTEGPLYNTIAMIAHFLGLFLSGFFIKKKKVAKMIMVIATVGCIAGSLIFFLEYSYLWNVALIVISFLSGLFVACWGYYFKILTSTSQRLKIAADVIIYSNMMMMVINVLAINVSALFALALSIMALCGALFLTLRLENQLEDSSNVMEIKHKTISQRVSLMPLIMLSVFVLIITINSGLMYQVVNPKFSHFELVTTYYWIVPYIAVIFIIRNLPSKINLSYLLYVALAMIGISYISFMLMDRSVSSYFIINTLMLGALGVFDLFWWSILGSFFDYYDNPVQVWGVGLAMNVLGISIGGIIGGWIMSNEQSHNTSIIALVVVLMAMMILPILHNQLGKVLKNHVFIMQFSGLQGAEQNNTLLDLKEKHQLTDREIEIIERVLRGYTYKAISGDLYISENTIKYHTKNIYQKLHIKSKMELIKLFSKDKD